MLLILILLLTYVQSGLYRIWIMVINTHRSQINFAKSAFVTTGIGCRQSALAPLYSYLFVVKGLMLRIDQGSNLILSGVMDILSGSNLPKFSL